MDSVKVIAFVYLISMVLMVVSIIVIIGIFLCVIICKEQIDIWNFLHNVIFQKNRKIFIKNKSKIEHINTVCKKNGLIEIDKKNNIILTNNGISFMSYIENHFVMNVTLLTAIISMIIGIIGIILK